MTERAAPTRVAIAAAIDLAAIAVFVAAGREEHDDGSAATPFLEIAAPFLIGIVLAWLVSPMASKPLRWQTGVAIWAITVPIGMVLRRTLFGDGTALAFILVTAAFLGLTLIGWRVLAGGITR